MAGPADAVSRGVAVAVAVVVAVVVVVAVAVAVVVVVAVAVVVGVGVVVVVAVVVAVAVVVVVRARLLELYLHAPPGGHLSALDAVPMVFASPRDVVAGRQIPWSGRETVLVRRALPFNEHCPR